MFEQYTLQTLSQKLNNIMHGLGLLVPEIALFILFVVMILLDLVIKKHKTIILSSLMLSSIIGLMVLLHFFQVDNTLVLFDGALQLSPHSTYYRYLLVLSTILSTILYLYSSFYKDHKKNIGVYYAILVGLLLGLHLIVLSNNFMMLYVGIEIVSIASYILTVFGFKKKSASTGVKYLLYGAMASGVMLYGISWLYGIGGGLSFDLIHTSQPSMIHFLGVMMVLGGLLFKMGAFPLHIWAPDVYEDAPTAVAAFFSTAPKVAIIAILHRLMAFEGELYHIGEITFSLQDCLMVVALLSITWGNLAALLEKNIKRILAFSGIAQAGFVMMLLLRDQGIANHEYTLYFFLVYILSNFLLFGGLAFWEKEMDTASIEAWAGIGKKKIALAIMMMIGLLSLAGIPPTAGFTAKMAIFTDFWGKIETLSGWSYRLHLSVLIVGILNTAIGLFYYLKWPYYLFFKEASDTKQALKSSVLQMIFLVVLTALILLLFFVPTLFKHI